MELDDLYQEIILDHYKQPRNQGQLSNATVHISGKNPFCGDELDLSLIIKDDLVQDIAFKGSGCAISQASISVMTEQVKGKTVNEVRELIDKFSGMVKGEKKIDLDTLEDLSAFQGVCEYPTRVKCAMLGWNALKKAIDSEQNNEKTEQNDAKS